jgi:nitrogen regulatory protein PII
MKAVFIVYNQAHTEKVEFMFDQLKIRGYTQWDNMSGRGSVTGPPHMGTHTWPESNAASLTVVEDKQVDILLQAVQRLNDINTEVGIRAFVWNVEQSV